MKTMSEVIQKQVTMSGGIPTFESNVEGLQKDVWNFDSEVHDTLYFQE